MVRYFTRRRSCAKKKKEKKSQDFGFVQGHGPLLLSPVTVIQWCADTTEGEGARFPPICKKNDCWAQIFQITVVTVSD